VAKTPTSASASPFEATLHSLMADSHLAEAALADRSPTRSLIFHSREISAAADFAESAKEKTQLGAEPVPQSNAPQMPALSGLLVPMIPDTNITLAAALLKHVVPLKPKISSVQTDVSTSAESVRAPKQCSRASRATQSAHFVIDKAPPPPRKFFSKLLTPSRPTVGPSASTLFSTPLKITWCPKEVPTSLTARHGRHNM
jgi:hypothetical protein